MADDFGKQVRAFRAMARDSGAVDIVGALADEWVKVAGRKSPVDTGYLQSSVFVKSRTGTTARAEAVVVADANYAGYVEYGTRYQRPQPYFRLGRDAAEQLVDAVEGKLRTSVERAMSGGSWGPPRF